MRVIDTQNRHRTLIQGEVPLTPASTLRWAGFSEEGQLFTLDTAGILRGLFLAEGANWVPLLDIRRKFQMEPTGIWLIGVCDREVVTIPLRTQ